MSVTLQKIVEDSLTFSEEIKVEGKLGDHTVKLVFDIDHEPLKQLLKFDRMDYSLYLLREGEKTGRSFLRDWTFSAGMATMAILPTYSCEEEDLIELTLSSATYLLGLRLLHNIFQRFVAPSSERIELYDLCCKVDIMEYESQRKMTTKKALIETVREDIEMHNIPKYLGEPLLNTIYQLSLAEGKRLRTIVMLAFPIIGVDPTEADVLDIFEPVNQPMNEPKILRKINSAFLREKAEKIFKRLFEIMEDEQVINLVHSIYNNDNLLKMPLDRSYALQLLCDNEGVQS